MQTVDEVRAHMNLLFNCCLTSGIGFDPDDVDTVIAVVGDPYCDGVEGGGERTTLYRRSGGLYVVVEDSEDYTGHGCVCHSGALLFDSVTDAVTLGMGREARDRYLSGER